MRSAGFSNTTSSPLASVTLYGKTAGMGVGDGSADAASHGAVVGIGIGMVPCGAIGAAVGAGSAVGAGLAGRARSSPFGWDGRGVAAGIAVGAGAASAGVAGCAGSAPDAHPSANATTSAATTAVRAFLIPNTLVSPRKYLATFEKTRPTAGGRRGLKKRNPASGDADAGFIRAARVWRHAPVPFLEGSRRRRKQWTGLAPGGFVSQTRPPKTPTVAGQRWTSTSFLN